MTFPKVGRVKYAKNVLGNVLCQVRFPTILKIETDLPSEFQQRLSPEFVNLIERQELGFDIQAGNVSDVRTEDLRQLSSSSFKNYEFSSENDEWKVNLTKNFIALSTNKYESWEEFQHKFESVLNTFIEIYKPVLFTRIGLRYVDVIVRSITVPVIW